MGVPIQVPRAVPIQVLEVPIRPGTWPVLATEGVKVLEQALSWS